MLCFRGMRFRIFFPPATKFSMTMVTSEAAEAVAPRVNQSGREFFMQSDHHPSPAVGWRPLKFLRLACLVVKFLLKTG